MLAWEAIAVLMAITYLVLAIRQNIWCWAAAAVSTSIYLFIMFEARLYMESVLQLFYLAMAAYGWPLSYHVFAIGSVLLLVFASGHLLSQYTDAALPHVDSFTTWGAVIATYMVARKVLENWVYWFVIDAVSVGLYLNRGLLLTALLFIFYLVLIILGYRSWRASMQQADMDEAGTAGA
jgi:nicotinamide mononucleotide transporter